MKKLLLNLFILLFSVNIALAGDVTDVRYNTSDNYTRIVIDLSEKSVFKHHLLKKDPKLNKPPRLFIDISNAKIGANVKKDIPINNGLLKKVRLGQYDKNTVRVVLDIESIDSYKVFPLTGPYRIVIDIDGETTKVSKAEIKKTDKKKDIKKHAKSKKDKVASKKDFLIVIDPGHGGKDPGALGRKGLKEKDITLKISKLLSKKLKNKTNANIHLTRRKDVFIPLPDRTAIANAKNADLFVSIHVNASPNRKATGVETYFLGTAKDKKSIEVSARENAATVEEMDDVLSFILADLEITGNRNESITLANYVQKKMSKGLMKKYKEVTSNGVKSALFYVLLNSKMPSILVETSFISNPVSEKRMKTNKYLDDIAEGIAKGIVNYMESVN